MNGKTTTRQAANSVAVQHRPDGTGMAPHGEIGPTIDRALQLAQQTGVHSRKDVNR